jgi:hypothetical protein
MDIGPKNLADAEVFFKTKLISHPLFVILNKSSALPDFDSIFGPIQPDIMMNFLGDFNTADTKEKADKGWNLIVRYTNIEKPRTGISLLLVGLTSRAMETTNRCSKALPYWTYRFTGWFEPWRGMWRARFLSDILKIGNYQEEMLEDMRKNAFSGDLIYFLRGAVRKQNGSIAGISLNKIESAFIKTLYGSTYP